MAVRTAFATCGRSTESQLFASRGYAVLQVNFRGSGGYGMDFEAAGYCQWALACRMT